MIQLKTTFGFSVEYCFLCFYQQSLRLRLIRMQDTWVGTDALGRKVPTSNEVGLTKGGKKRTVGIFYINGTP